MAGGREAILNAAIAVFAQKGYAAASTREICQAANLTKPVLYYHFRGKEHLYQELMIDIFSFYRKNMLLASKTEGTLRERLVNMMDAEFRAAREDPARVRFLLRMIFSPEEQHPYFNYVDEMERKREILRQVIKEGMDRERVRGDALELATAYMAMQLFAVLENLFTGRVTLTREKAEVLVGIILQGAGAC